MRVSGFDSPSLDMTDWFRDLVTTSEDWIMSPHPTCTGLYIVTAGSFHAFKMFPILGKYAVQMLDGNLDSELEKRWAWHQQMTPPGGRELFPTRDLKDFVS